MLEKNIDVIIKDNEEVIYPFIWVNGEVEDVTIKATIIGNNASFLLCGIFLGTMKKNVTFNTQVEHVGKGSRSLTSIRGVFSGESSFSNDGLVRINKGAKKTDGYFQSKILLFDNAKGRSVPSLEIDENEVKAGHGSTVGMLDPMQLFYMRSRGIDEKSAQSLLVQGFFDPIISLLPEEEQKKTIKKLKSV